MPAPHLTAHAPAQQRAATVGSVVFTGLCFTAAMAAACPNQPCRTAEPAPCFSTTPPSGAPLARCQCICTAGEYLGGQLIRLAPGHVVLVLAKRSRRAQLPIAIHQHHNLVHPSAHITGCRHPPTLRSDVTRNAFTFPLEIGCGVDL